MNSELSKVMSKRDYHHRRAVKSNSPDQWKKYKELKSFVNREVKKSKSSYYNDLIIKNKDKPSQLWKSINEITSRSTPHHPTCIIADKKSYTSPKSISEVLNLHFSTIGKKLADQLRQRTGTPPPIIPPTDSVTKNQFKFQEITISFVQEQIRKLKTNKAIGLDRISARLLKDAAEVIAPSLTQIFNLSLESGTFPAIWKSGRVAALFKKGDRTNPVNYRPITILPTLSKILERAVHNQLYHFLSENNLLTNKQYGFRPKLCTDTAILKFTDKVLKNMESGHLTGAVFLDLAKAFDTVDHDLLVKKMSSFGLTNESITWFKSYLSNRQQITAINQFQSLPQAVSIGVPQGSIIGPLLFLIFINDLPCCLESCETTLYADDTVLYFSSKSIVDLENKINNDLCNVATWLNNNLLTLNVDKSEFILIGSSYKLKNCNTINISINNNPVKQRNAIKYLGITMNRNLTWSDHVEEIGNKCNQRIGILKRVRDLLPLETRELLYKSLILPTLHYADIIWGDKDNITLMEDLQILQNKAAKAILGWPLHSSASDALNKLKWNPLSCKRKLNRAFFTFKCINGLTDFDLNLKTNQTVHNHNTRRRHDIRLPAVKTNWGKQRFAYQAAKEWNEIDIHTRNSDSLSIFKRKMYLTF